MTVDAVALGGPTVAVDGPAPVAAPGAQRFWFAILLLAIAIGAGGAMRIVFSPLAEAAKLDMGLTDSQLGLVQGIAVALPIALLSIPLGWMTDHTRRVRILLAMVVLWTAGTLMTGFVDGFWMLFAARTLAGLGAGCALPVCISLAADLCAPEKRGRAMMYISLGNVAGAAVAFGVGGGLLGAFTRSDPAIAGLAPWREVHLVFGLFSAALILPMLLLREPVRREVSTAGSAIGPAARALWARRRFLGPLFVGQISVVMADSAAGVWAAPVLIRHYHQSPEQFSAIMGLILLTCGVAGAAIGGFVADWGQKRPMRGGVMIGAVVASAIGIPAALFPIMPSLAGFFPAIALLLLCGTVTGLVAAVAITVLVPNEFRGLCLGAFMVIGALFGLGLAPQLVTEGSRLLGGEGHLNQALAITGVAASILSFIAFWLSMRAAPRSATEV
ncbi:MAG: MFS transporter [Caulobacteraceae bacterium]|nr:MAG: MFS transporter [Caulobacteraceae bacterium]